VVVHEIGDNNPGSERKRSVGRGHPRRIENCSTAGDSAIASSTVVRRSTLNRLGRTGLGYFGGHRLCHGWR
jgi:hypothetical protein